jgi:hypothetical protein
MPTSEVRTGAMLAALVAVSAPVTVTLAPTMTAPLGSTTVTWSVAAPGVCAKALGAERPSESVRARTMNAHQAVRQAERLIFRSSHPSRDIAAAQLPPTRLRVDGIHIVQGRRRAPPVRVVARLTINRGQKFAGNKAGGVKRRSGEGISES